MPAKFHFTFYDFINSSSFLLIKTFLFTFRLNFNLNSEWNWLYLSKKRLKKNLKVLHYQILTSVKNLEKTLEWKANFSIVLQLSCSYFTLKLCKRRYNYKSSTQNQFWRGLERVRSKKLIFRDNNSKILETKSSFYVK